MGIGDWGLSVIGSIRKSAAPPASVKAFTRSNAALSSGCVAPAMTSTSVESREITPADSPATSMERTT